MIGAPLIDAAEKENDSSFTFPSKFSANMKANSNSTRISL